MTYDPTQTDVRVNAEPYRNLGSIIDSCNSIHFAGGGEEMAGREVFVRVVAGGDVSWRGRHRALRFWLRGRGWNRVNEGSIFRMKRLVVETAQKRRPLHV